MKHPFFVHKQANTLDQLAVGGHGIVLAVGGEEAMRQRLQDIGILEATDIWCVGESPLGDPHAYLIRGCIMALRQHDSSQIRIREVVSDDDAS